MEERIGSWTKTILITYIIISADIWILCQIDLACHGVTISVKKIILYGAVYIAVGIFGIL